MVRPAQTPAAETMTSAVVAPIHTGNGAMLPANPAIAICVLSPNSATRINNRAVKKMPWPGFSVTVSGSSSPRSSRA